MMEKWEYCVVSARKAGNDASFTIHYEDKSVEPRGNERLAVIGALGKVGWELVSVQEISHAMTEYFFKRPRA
jgi:hypothetical protein